LLQTRIASLGLHKTRENTVELDPNSTDYTERLLQCMQQRLELLQALVGLTNAEREASDNDDIDVTLGLLARKQGLIDDLVDVQSSLQPFMHDDPEARVWSSPERREECRRLADAGGQLLLRILQLDQTAIEQLTSKRDAVAAQLRDGQDSILARTAYTADSVFQEGTLDVQDL